jgi:hypothetical protein
MTDKFTELASEFNIQMSETGILARRTFVKYDDTELNGITSPVGQPITDLPKIGDDLFGSNYTASYTKIIDYLTSVNFDTTKENIYLRNIKIGFLGNDIRKPMYICNYSNEPIDTSIFPDNLTLPPANIDNLPQDIEYNIEVVVIPLLAENKSLWKWKSDNTVVVQPFQKFVKNFKKKITRFVRDEDATDFELKIKRCIGKINTASIFNPDPAINNIGCVLFTEVQHSYFYGVDDTRYNRYDLTFALRDVDGTWSDGWNKIIREVVPSDLKWAIPYNILVDKYIYNSEDLSVLLDGFNGFNGDTP